MKQQQNNLNNPATAPLSAASIEPADGSDDPGPRRSDIEQGKPL